MASKSSAAIAGPRLPGIRTKGDLVAGRYRVLTVLGRSPTGYVVSARHVHLRNTVRLKLLPAATRAQQRGQRVILARAHEAAGIAAPGLARVLDTGFTEDGDAFVATAPVDGQSLRARLDGGRGLPCATAVAILAAAARALAPLHAEGVQHGNLKPANVFVDGEDTAPAVTLTDLGMAASLDEDGPGLVAAPGYLAPELVAGDVRTNLGARADVWALGAMLHQCLAGTLPFTATSAAAMLVAVATAEPAPLGDDVPAWLRAVVTRCLARDPAARFADAGELARALAAGEGASVVTAAEGPAADEDAPPAVRTALYPLVMHSMVVPVAREARPEGTPEEGAGEAAAAPVVVPPPPRLPSFAPVLEAPSSTPHPRSSAAPQRRRAAIAVVCGAALVALVGFALPANDARAGSLETERPPISPPGEEVTITPAGLTPPPVFVPPSFALPEMPSSVRPEELPVDPAAPISVPVTTASALPTLSSTAGAKLLASPHRPTLAVRTDPYTTGFTHPSALGAAQK